MPPVTKEMLEARAAAVRTGGPGSVRRHNKVAHKSGGADDKKVLNVIKRLGVQPIGEVEEVRMLRNDKTQLVFKKPRVQSNPQSNVLVCAGNYETMPLSEAELNRASQMDQMAQLQQMMAQLRAKDPQAFAQAAAQAQAQATAPAAAAAKNVD